MYLLWFWLPTSMLITWVLVNVIFFHVTRNCVGLHMLSNVWLYTTLNYYILRLCDLLKFYEECQVFFFEVESCSVAPARVQGCDVILDHCNLRLLGSSDSPSSASQVAEIIEFYHHAQLIFCIFSRDGVPPFARLVWNPWRQVIGPP